LWIADQEEEGPGLGGCPGRALYTNKVGGLRRSNGDGLGRKFRVEIPSST